MSLTSAPGMTAPLVSTTLPLIWPLVVCARALEEINKQIASKATSEARLLFMRFVSWRRCACLLTTGEQRIASKARIVSSSVYRREPGQGRKRSPSEPGQKNELQPCYSYVTTGR